jgi:signal transduction histidine kinase
MNKNIPSIIKSKLTEVRWQWVLLAGVGAVIGSSFIITAIISIYVVILVASSGGIPDPDKIGEFSRQISTFGGPILTLLFVIVGAAWVGRKVERNVVLHGLGVGLIAAFIGQATSWPFTGVQVGLEDLFWYLLFVGAGWLGSTVGQIVFTGQEELYRASRAIGKADTWPAIVEAIGEKLAGSDVSHIGLWQVTTDAESNRPVTVELSTVWQPHPGPTAPTDLRLEAASIPAQVQPQSAWLLPTKELDHSESWEQLGLRSVLLLPLIAADGSWVGLLTVASPRAKGLPRRVERMYLTVSSQITLALENLRLMEQARQTGVLQERQRLAHEIHDTLAQGFTSIVMHLEAAEQALPPEHPTVQRHLDLARKTARKSLTQARRVVQALRPEPLEQASLPEAINRVVARWSEESSIPAHTTLTGDPQPLHPEVEVTLLRVTQEALANVRKHAQAGQVNVTLSYMADVIVLDVQDDGVGMNHTPVTDATSGGFGLTAMRERVEQLHGSLLIESVPGEGTTLVVEIPLAGVASSGNL